MSNYDIIMHEFLLRKFNGPEDARPFVIEIHSGGDPIGSLWRFVPGLEAHGYQRVEWDFTSGPVIDNVYVWADSKPGS